MRSLNTDVTGKAETRSHWSMCGGGFIYHNWVPKNAWSLDAGWGTGTQVKMRKREAEMGGKQREGGDNRGR